MKRVVWTEQARADGIEQPIAWQILKTLGRYVLTVEGATKQLRGISPPLFRLRAQNHRVFFRDHGDYLKIERVLDRSRPAETCDLHHLMSAVGFIAASTAWPGCWHPTGQAS